MLSILHWYWVVGGQWGLSGALPSTGEKLVFKPGPLATALVALLLMFAALICLAHAEVADLPASLFTRIGVGGLMAAFAIRAIGDFRYVGFFKRIKKTNFARMDSIFFTPLCVFVSLLCGLLLSMN